MIESYVSLKALASVTQVNRKPVKSKLGQCSVMNLFGCFVILSHDGTHCASTVNS